MSWKDILNKGEQSPPGAPQLGSQEQQSVSSYASVQQWKAQIVSLLERYKQYPIGAQSKGEQGVVQVFFSLDRLGQVIASRIVRSSGSSALDAEVQALLRRAQPFPEPPEELAGNQVDLTVPIRFSLPEHTAQQSAPGAPQPGSPPNSPESAGQSHVPSFDCKSTKNPNEKLICQSTELSELDNRMVVVFEAVMNLLNSGDRQELRSHQREWLKDRLDCDDDFLCTKGAYENRIQKLNSIAAKLANRARSTELATRCRVSDPSPPLTVRTTPNGTSVGSLPNDTFVRVLDYSENQSWMFVGKDEDRSPIGWVYGEYLDCKANTTGGDWSFLSFLNGLIAYDCSLIRHFPESQKEDKDPVIGTTVIIAYDERRERFLGIEVHHELKSGTVHKRHEQYRDYKTAVSESKDVTSYKWTGVFAINRSISMKGELTVVADMPSDTRYTEEMIANGKLDWAGIWSCVSKTH